jgi:hypothetical protein
LLDESILRRPSCRQQPFRAVPFNSNCSSIFKLGVRTCSSLDRHLTSGSLSDAQTAYNSIVSLGQGGPFAGGNPFKLTQREQDFAAVGQALQSGDLAGAQQAFGALETTFQSSQAGGPGGGLSPTPVASPAASSGPEIILNLSNSSGSPEQITINVSNSANGGGEQVSLSVGNQASNTPELTFNLSPNSNEQIVLNLLDGSSSTSTSSSASTCLRAEESAFRLESANAGAVGGNQVLLPAHCPGAYPLQVPEMSS